MFKYVRLTAHDNPRISILDLGTGAGAAASLIVRSISDDSNESFPMLRYVFASTREEESRQAEERLNHLKPFVEFKAVSLRENIMSQGLQTENFDIIILSSFGDSHDLEERLIHAKRLLKQRGKLCIVSIINPGLQLSLVSRCMEVLQR